jgi:hypothetical protein
MNYSQPNITLRLVRELVKFNRETSDVSARNLAEAVSPAFPDVPLPLLRVIAAKLLAVFYEPITADDLAELNSVERQDVNEFLDVAYRETAEALVRSERAAPIQ